MAEVETNNRLASGLESPMFGEDGSFRLDKPVGSASISPCSRDVVLASRQGLHIIDLDSPWSPPRHLAHHTPWEVADVQWSPFAARDYWVVSTSNQKALVWNLAMASSQSSVEHALHGHSRAITDINFSAHYPDILATCAVDSFVHCWDLRHPARPAMTFCDWFAGATQVKWNRQDPHILASSHDKFLRVWDDRKGAYPLRSIEAHATKIYGVDWSRTETSNLVTCSLDRTIKFWNYTKDRDEPDRVIHTPFPVWRARHTPFGFGLLAMPQRGDHDLHLYDRRQDVGQDAEHTVTAVHRFYGHDDQVKEFLWRSRGNVTEDVDDREFQLVSWGTDRVLRLQKVDEKVLANVGYKKGMQVKRRMNITRKNAVYKTFREDPSRTEGNTSGGEGAFKGAGTLGMGAAPNTGMSGAPVPFIRGYGNGGYMTPMIGHRTGSTNEMDPISWMRGVRIGKREPSPSGMHQSASSNFTPSIKTDQAWDLFENLGEEITHVADKFTKVKFDEIDVNRRRVQVSLTGPWGPEKSSTYLKVCIDFPDNYPNAAAPSLGLEQTTSISEETIDEIYAGAHSIASGFKSQQRNSLEAILRYLLGERNSTESLLWLKKRQESVDLGSTQDLDPSSSDEEDEGLGRYPGDPTESMEASDPMIAVSNAQYNVPLHKACGAFWAEDGRLVCFFPSRQEKESSLQDLSIRASDRSSGSRKNVFEDFGRLHSDPTRQKRAASTLETIESGDSEPEYSSAFSSSSSSSSDNMGLPRHHFIPSMALHSDSHQGLVIDDSQKSSGGAEMAKSTVMTPRNYVAIYDLKELLPAKKHLASSYTIHGGSSGCAHNARIARESGDPDLAQVWSFVELIIQEKVPLESKVVPGSNAPVAVVAPRAASRLKPKDSAIDLSFDAVQGEKHRSLRGSVKWGDHPLGRRWFVDSLFRHFEQLADVQMLAMLACILDEPQASNKSTGKSIYGSSPDHTPPFHHHFASRYYPSEEVARSHLNLLSPSELSVQVDSQRMISGPHSTSSSFGPASDLSTSETPPLQYKSTRTSPEHRNPQSPSLSTLTEYQRHTHRSNSNLSAFASLPRPFPFGSAASSPPNSYPKKRSSPVGSYLGNTASMNVWNSGFFGKSSAITEAPKSSLSLSVSDAEEDVVPIAKKPVFMTKLKNQDQFHNDGYANVPLLDPSKEWCYHAYREAYAHLLYVWDMPIARAEVLNHNRPLHPDTLAPDTLATFTFGPKTTAPFGAIAGANLSADYNTENLNPVFRDHCPFCSTLLLPTQKPSHRCQSCSKLQPAPLCLLCNTAIRGLASPCSNCGHVVHASCRQLLSQASLDECPSGCGCICAEYTFMRLTTSVAGSVSTRDESQPEDVSPADSPLPIVTGGEGVNEQEQLGWKEQGWENAAYESLARNLRPRTESRGKMSM